MEIIKYFKKFFIYFKESKLAFISYSVLSLVAGILELCGVALIYPFIIKILESGSDKKLPIIIGISIIAIFLLKNLFMIFYINIQTRFTNNLESDIKKRIMGFFLNSKYQDTYKITIAEKNNIFNLLIPNITNNFIFRLLNINVNLFIFCLISALLAVKFPLATIVTLMFAVVLIKFQNHIYKPLLIKYGKKVSETSLSYHQNFNESILNFKGIKISNNENFFGEKFNNATDNYYKNYKNVSFLNQIPPYITEPFAIILLFVLLLIISAQNYAEPQKLIASFALIASAIFRLVPTISRLQVNINGINAATPLIREFINFYEKYNVSASQKDYITKDTITFRENIELKNVSFGYDEKEILHNISFKINKGEFIGITGESGAGKTTLIDLIAGLFEPKSGQILVDGEAYQKNLSIGYIPQDFKIVHGSIKDNVVFGSNIIDDNKVIDALKQAQIYDFISENFEEGIYAEPFSDSVGFSQGQKQRLAIARALYSNPEILLLDEATSSLDLKTEDEICHVLNRLKGEKTIIVIAHRLTTIKAADKIFFMEHGEISASGNFCDLMKISSKFKESVKIAFDNKI